MKRKEQGLKANKHFLGEHNSEIAKLLYSESALFFSQIINSTIDEGTYSVLDIGSHEGELLRNIDRNLPNYSFIKTAIDVNDLALANNTSERIVVCDSRNMPFMDKEFDLTICRYVLAWNSLNTQKEIIEEIKRVTSGIALLQHQGADPEDPTLLQKSSEHLFNGQIPQLKRDNFYFSTRNELKDIFDKLSIKYNTVQERKIAGLSTLLSEKYLLSETQTELVRAILSNSDYVFQSTFVLDFRNS